MWNYHSWPLDVSRNVKLPFLTTRYLWICHCTGISLYFLISWLFWMESHWPHRTAKRSLFSLAVSNGGSIYLWYLYVYIFTGIFLYFLVSWLFQMGSHWPHWTVQRSLCALAVSNGGSICLWYPYVYICTGIFLYFLISWLFLMGSHWPHWTVKRSLCALAVSNGGRTSPVIFSSGDCFEWVLIDGMDTHRVNSFSLAVLHGGDIGQSRFICQIWAHFKFCSCFTELFHFL